MTLKVTSWARNDVIDCHVHLWMLRSGLELGSLVSQNDALCEVIEKGDLNGMYVFGKRSHEALCIKSINEGGFYAGGYIPWSNEAEGFNTD
jgi:hypothetical protein